MSRSLNILIYGAGSLGSLLGFYLARSREVSLSLIGRDNHVSAIRNNGLKLLRGSGMESVSINAYTSINKIRFTPDLVILAVRAYQTKIALQDIINCLGHGIYILTFQNGFLLDIISEYIGSGRTIGGVTYTNSRLDSSGIVSEMYRAPFIFAGVDNVYSSAVVERLKQIFIDAGLDAFISKGIRDEAWGKVIINGISNTISGLTNLTLKQIYQSADCKMLSYHLAKESFMIADLEGVNWKNILSQYVLRCYESVKTQDGWFSFIEKDQPDIKLSMCALLARGLRTEVDFTNGFIAASAQKHKKRAAYNEAVIAAVHDIENGKIKPIKENCPLVLRKAIMARYDN
jgi:2-dehydropantoate 2-reductase